MIPDTMHAIRVEEPGDADVLRLCELPVPAPEKGEVLVRVTAAGLNRIDIILRQPDNPLPVDQIPEIPGLELSGVVVATGESVSSLAIGDRVCALAPTGGAYSQYCRVPASLCWPIPEALSENEAAALPEAVMTVWNTLFANSVLKPGESILIHGGTSGIGSFAIKLIQALDINVQVLATAGSDAKCQAMATWGVDRAINYREENFVDVVRNETSNCGVDVVLDVAGGDYINRNIEALGTKGRMVHIGIMTGPHGMLNVAPLMAKRVSLIGANIWFQSLMEKAVLAGDITEHVWPLLEAGLIRPAIDSVFPLEQATEAQQRMEQGKHIGKILLSVEG